MGLYLPESVLVIDEFDVTPALEVEVIHSVISSDDRHYVGWQYNYSGVGWASFAQDTIFVKSPNIDSIEIIKPAPKKLFLNPDGSYQYNFNHSSLEVDSIYHLLLPKDWVILGLDYNPGALLGIENHTSNLSLTWGYKRYLEVDISIKYDPELFKKIIEIYSNPNWKKSSLRGKDSDQMTRFLNGARGIPEDLLIESKQIFSQNYTFHEQERSNLEKLLSEALELQSDLERTLMFSSDPKERARSLKNLAEIKGTIESYKERHKSLE